MRAFASRVEVVTTEGHHVRYAPAALAAWMVDNGAAAIHNANGKVKSIRLLESASTHAHMIGPPSDPKLGGIRFTRWVRLEQSAARIIEYHPRCTDYE